MLNIGLIIKNKYNNSIPVFKIVLLICLCFDFQKTVKFKTNNTVIVELIRMFRLYIL